MQTVYLVRHCQSVANQQRLYSSKEEEDAGLSPEGLAQAEQVADFFVSRHLRALFASPFKRTIQTADAISKVTKVKVQKNKHFRELDCGVWHGKTELEIQKKFPDEWKGWHYDPQNNPIPKGEALSDVQARAFGEFNRLARTYHDKGDIAIVTHYCVFNVLLCSLVSSLANFRSFDTGNGTIAEIKMEHVPRLRLYESC